MTTFALLDQFSGWWTGMTFPQQVFYGIGLLAGFASLILAALAFLGLEHHDAIDAAGTDLDHGGGGVFSIKPLTGFFLGFGWAGAIKGLQFEKIVVMGGNANGGTGPGQFVQDLYKGVLPINELAKSVGLNLPAFLGATAQTEQPGAAPATKPSVPSDEGTTKRKA